MPPQSPSSAPFLSVTDDSSEQHTQAQVPLTEPLWDLLQHEEIQSLGPRVDHSSSLCPARVHFSWHRRVNRCEQVHGDLACQGWHRSRPSLTRDGNCHLLQAAHQNTLLPGTSTGSYQLVSRHRAIVADGQKGCGVAEADPSWRCAYKGEREGLVPTEGGASQTLFTLDLVNKS